MDFLAMYQKEKKLARIRRRIDQVMEAKSVTPLEGTKDSERQAERNAGSINPPDAGQKEHQKGIRAEELQVYEAFFKSSKFLTCSEYLGQWRLGGDSIKDIFYIPDFIDEDTEQFILNQTYAVPDSSWVQLRERRLQATAATVATAAAMAAAATATAAATTPAGAAGAATLAAVTPAPATANAAVAAPTATAAATSWRGAPPPPPPPPSSPPRSPSPPPPP
mmetsp:Transcript_25062/g.41470  ORF Transcript_25062/g.41470 Transcript_25062/m.41470 type:complete len:221 (-) Transcript_25062:11-673(-)